jgi:nickel-dependent lactate racemase
VLWLLPNFNANFVGSLISRVDSYKPGKSPKELVEASLDHPIGSAKFEEFVNGKKRPQGSESG